MAEDESSEKTNRAATSLKEKVVEDYRKIKEHADTYPYVWASYILVYGGISLWTAYRWRRLRNTENRVRVLQERLRKLVEEEEKSASSSTTSSSSIDKPSK